MQQALIYQNLLKSLIWLIQNLFGIKVNNVISTNSFVLLAKSFAYYPVRIIKPLYLKKQFSLASIFSSNIIKAHLSQ